jgi:ribosomal protein L37E
MAMSKCRECGKAVSTLAKTCPHCGVPKPVKKITKKVKKKKKNKETFISKGVNEFKRGLTTPTSKKGALSGDFNKVWAHCRNYKCRDYTQVYNIYKDYLDIERCKLCKSAFMEAKIENGNPIMPTGGIYDKLKDKSEIYTSSKSSSSKRTSSDKGVYDKFADGKLDLATAFWLFGILGSFVGSLILTLLAESVSKIFYIPFVGLNIFIIAALWECAENYKKEKLQKKQSAVWGYLTHVFCVVGGLGLISTVYDIIKTL